MITSLANPVCFVCGTSNNKKIFVSHNVHGRIVVDIDECFNVHKCNTCDALYIGNVIVSKKYQQKYYPEDYYNAPALASVRFEQKMCLLLEKFSFSRKAKLFNKLLKKKYTYNVLDIGCGTGKFLLSLDSSVFMKYGIEIHPEGYKQCIQSGIIAYNLPLEDIDFGTTKFDVITLFHVLEHLENPSKILLATHSLLADDGILMLVVPNNCSIGAVLGREHWFHLDSPRHLFIPSARTIEYLANITNLSIIKKLNEFYDYPLDLFWSVKYSKFKYLIYLLYPFFKLFSNESKTFILKKREL